MAQNPSPEVIFQLSTGTWASAVLGCGVTHRVFEHLDNGGLSAEELSERSGLALRGARALLDGLVGVGLLSVDADCSYRNTPPATTYLIPGRATYLGGFVEVQAAMLRTWANLPEAVHDGEAPEMLDAVEENPFWEKLALSIAGMARPVARMAAERLSLATLEGPSILDIGGGSGIYSAEWLALNPSARATQVDWPNVNRMARDHVASHGVADRFETVDGDFHEVDFGEAVHDIAVYSNIAHQESPGSNRKIFRRLHRALRPGGTLVASDFVLHDDRSGPPFALLFHVNMLLHTRGGATYTESEYRTWLGEAGFATVEFQRTETPSTLVYATR